MASMVPVLTLALPGASRPVAALLLSMTTDDPVPTALTRPELKSRSSISSSSQGRGLVLSDAGRVALGYADQIFQLGDALVESVRNSDGESMLRLRAGISDGIPKLLAYRLLSSVTGMPVDVRLICDEGEFETLLADLALHRLDVVLTDRAAPVGGNLKVFSTRLGDFPTGLFGTPELLTRYAADFPKSLNDPTPMIYNRKRMRSI